MTATPTTPFTCRICHRECQPSEAAPNAGRICRPCKLEYNRRRYLAKKCSVIDPDDIEIVEYPARVEIPPEYTDNCIKSIEAVTRDAAKCLRSRDPSKKADARWWLFEGLTYYGIGIDPAYLERVGER
ncbi:hypothetical protein CCP3SC15_400024 [Gammaproteobacteria bacterium]